MKGRACFVRAHAERQRLRVDGSSVIARTRFGDGREGPQAAVETLEHLQFDVSPL
jgi:hypothetical protein